MKYPLLGIFERRARITINFTASHIEDCEESQGKKRKENDDVDIAIKSIQKKGNAMANGGETHELNL